MKDENANNKTKEPQKTDDSWQRIQEIRAEIKEDSKWWGLYRYLKYLWTWQKMS